MSDAIRIWEEKIEFIEAMPASPDGAVMHSRQAIIREARKRIEELQAEIKHAPKPTPAPEPAPRSSDSTLVRPQAMSADDSRYWHELERELAIESSAHHKFEIKQRLRRVAEKYETIRRKSQRSFDTLGSHFKDHLVEMGLTEASQFTCFGCPLSFDAKCPAAWDAYNTNGDCLMEK